jgi:uncharacterized iron-regulated membrane protein
MTIRKIFFWLHLSAGMVAGSVILAMCVTGAALGFEKQIVHWAQRHERTVAANDGAQLLSMDALLAQALQRADQSVSVTWRSQPNSTVELAYGRERKKNSKSKDWLPCARSRKGKFRNGSPSPCACRQVNPLM